MATIIHCDEEACEEETSQNRMDQWAKISVDVHSTLMEVHLCPTCWTKVLTRRALVLEKAKETK